MATLSLAAVVLLTNVIPTRSVNSLFSSVVNDLVVQRRLAGNRSHHFFLHLNHLHSDGDEKGVEPAARDDRFLKFNDTANLQCRVDFRAHPEDVVCPSACPFLRSEPTDICTFTCVAADKCGDDDPLSSYADPSSMRCSICVAQACAECGASRQQCKTCQENYELLEGECWSKDRFLWRAIYISLILVILVIILYLVTLALRDDPNSHVCDHALQFRYTSKLHDPNGSLYSFVKTNIRNMYISGIGVMLHFRWQYAVLLWSAFVCFGLWMVAFYFGHRPAVMKQVPTDPKHFDACNQDVAQQLEDVGHMENVYFFINFGLYIFTTVAAILFAVHQKRFANKTSQELTTMQDYVLKVSGLPRFAGTKDVERILTDFFRSKLPPAIQVIGVSPCWEYRKHAVDVDEQIGHELNEIEREFDETHAIRTLSGHEACHLRSATGIETNRSARLHQRVDGNFRRFDGIFGVETVEDELGTIGPEDRGKPEVKVLLQSFWTTQEAYLVLGSENQRDQAFEMMEKQPLTMRKEDQQCSQHLLALGKEFQLKAEKIDCEPDTVLWSSCGVTMGEFCINLILGGLFLLLALALLDVLFYFPSISYFLSVSDVHGMTQGGYQGTLLGLLVVICNQAIYFLIGLIADKCGFSTTDRHQRFYVVGYTAAVFVNTVIDLFVVLLLAQGYSMDQAMNAGHSNDSTMSTKAIAENPAMQKAIYDQFVMYIFPSCLLTPFLLEPLVNQLFFLISKWIVRSRTEVKLSQAESMLLCLPFDLSRYGDILVNVMLCAGTMAFTYRDLWVVFASLLVSLIWVYVYDSYRFLLGTTRSSFVTYRMDSTAHYLSAGVCSIFAATLAFRAYGFKSGEGHGVLEDAFKWLGSHVAFFGEAIQRDTIVLVMSIVALLHFLVHCFILKKIVPYLSDVEVKHDVDIDYAKTADKTPCTWFNANPVHCLRAKYIHESKVPCVFFRVGKEHLIKRNPDMGLYFERSELSQINKDESYREWGHGMLREVNEEVEENKKAAKRKVYAANQSVRDLGNAARQRIARHTSGGSGIFSSSTSDGAAGSRPEDKEKDQESQADPSKTFSHASTTQ